VTVEIFYMFQSQLSRVWCRLKERLSQKHSHVGPTLVWAGLSNWDPASFAPGFHVGPTWVCPDEMNTAQCAHYRLLNVTHISVGVHEIINCLNNDW